MGEIAEMMLDGTLDQYTGEYIGEPVGYPRSKHGNIQPKKSEDLSWRKVVNYITSCNIKPHKHPEVLKSYGCRYTGRHPLRNACFEVLRDFEKFKLFVRNYALDHKEEQSNG